MEKLAKVKQQLEVCKLEGEKIKDWEKRQDEDEFNQILRDFSNDYDRIKMKTLTKQNKFLVAENMQLIEDIKKIRHDYEALYDLVKAIQKVINS